MKTARIILELKKLIQEFRVQKEPKNPMHKNNRGCMKYMLFHWCVCVCVCVCVFIYAHFVNKKNIKCKKKQNLLKKTKVF